VPAGRAQSFIHGAAGDDNRNAARQSQSLSLSPSSTNILAPGLTSHTHCVKPSLNHHSPQIIISIHHRS
jgi:hypothetical protein